ncbi:MAG: type III secretion system chaperone [Chlamydiae bacterium]|nr:type III secretion system chaperone [Chlamydiota bacterium]
MLEDLLNNFSKEHGATYDYINEGSGGVFYLQISSELKVELRQLDNEGVFFRTNLFLFLIPDKETVFKQLLEANYLYQSTLGCVLGMDPNEKYITLSMYVYNRVTKNNFWDSLELFCNAWDYLKHNFEKKS